MGIDSVYLTPYLCNQQLNLGEDLVLCEGDTVILDATTLNASYDWNDGSDYRKLKVTETGYYSVQATVYNCPVIDSMILFDTVFVEFIPYPIIDLGGDTLFVCYNESIVLDAFAENASYIWQDSSTNSTYTVTQPGLYSVDVLRSICLFEDFVNIAYQFCVSEVEIPNVFSPNGDNVNDLFSPIKLEGIINLHTTIHNRWGQIVFVSDDLLLKWDGKDMMGKNVSEGVYFWQIEFEDEGNDLGKLDGYLTLVR